jgi:hypothetical protein
MSSLTLEHARPPLGLNSRWWAGGLGLLLAACASGLILRLSPSGLWLAPAGIGALIAVAALLYVRTATDDEIPFIARAFAIAAAIAAAAAASGLKGAALEPAFALASLALAGFAGYRCHAANAASPIWASGLTAAGIAALAAVLIAYDVWYVLASQDLEIADFMYFRLVSIAVASLIDAGRLPQLVFEVATSLKADYSWVAGLAPGFALAAGAPLSRAVYQAAIMVFYAAPALAALGWFARELAARAGFAPTKSLAALALATAAVAAVYPTGVAVAARGMPDVGGVALYVYALRTADKFTHAAVVGRARNLTRRLALTLALTFFAMFIFRRWYIFAAAGVAAAMAFELAVAAWRNRKTFAWGPLLNAGALAALTSAALASPILVDWAGDPGRHDYGSLYAAYRKPLDVFLGLIGDWWGFGVLAACAVAFAFLLARSREGRLARMTLLSGLIAAALFLRIQTPYVHHVYLVMPWAAALGAVILAIAQKSRLAGMATLAALAAVTLTPAGALAPKGLFPSYARPHAPRSDLAELARLKDWVDEHAAPSQKVCGLGSSYTFSGQLIDELWQLKADKSPLHLDKGERASVAMSDVDTVEGPPAPGLKDCAFLLVGDPVQTHLDPAYQQTVIVPSREMLDGDGIGAHYARTGEAFRLENGVTAVVFKRVTPLTDEDVAALAKRWEAARAR